LTCPLLKAVKWRGKGGEHVRGVREKEKGCRCVVDRKPITYRGMCRAESAARASDTFRDHGKTEKRVSTEMLSGLDCL